MKYDKKDKNGNIIYNSENKPVKGNISGKIEKVNGNKIESILKHLITNTSK